MAFKLSLFNFSVGKGKKNRSTKGIGGMRVQPFIENVEAGMPYMVSSSDIRDIVGALRGSYTDRTLLELFHSVAEVFTPIDIVATRVAGAKFMFRNEKTGEIIENNPQLDALIGKSKSGEFKAVNPLQNFQQMIYESIVYEFCTGKNFWYINIPNTLAIDYKNIAAQYNLPADRITIDTPERVKLFSATRIGDIIKGYIFNKGNDDEYTYPVEKIIYRKKVNMNWNGRKIEGSSPLLSAEKALKNLIAVYIARGMVYIKHGAMGMWVSAKTDASGNVSMTSAEKKAAREEVDRDYGITDPRKHTVGLTDVPMRFEKTSMSIADMEPFMETKADAAAIFAVIGVPEEFIPDAEGTAFANANNATKRLYQDTVIPLAESIAESLTMGWGIRKWGYSLIVTFDHIEILQDNKKEAADTDKTKIESYTKLYKDGGITYNEWLIKLGYPSRGPEFDKYINELEQVPMAVKIGVGGTQAMQSVVADPNLSEESKANLLVLLFGITIEQARVVVVSKPENNGGDNGGAN